MSQTFFVLPTAAGEARDANAKALGLPRRYTHMGVGDGGGALPTPDRNRTALVGEHHRAPLNALWQDPGNPSQFVAELVIPETVGGWWIRELGLYDEDGTLCYYGNCPESYKPKMAEGSGRTQVVRMVVLAAPGVSVELKIDPSVVLATREYCDNKVESEIAKLDAKRSVRAATTGPIAPLTGLHVIDGVQLVTGDRVLVKDEVASEDNGIYVAAPGDWVRSDDAASSIHLTPGLFVPVEEGTVNADSLWQLVTDAPITIGMTLLAFEKVGGKTGVAPGTYRSVTINARGQVIGGTNPTTLEGCGITDALPRFTSGQALPSSNIGPLWHDDYNSLMTWQEFTTNGANYIGYASVLVGNLLLDTQPTPRRGYLRSGAANLSRTTYAALRGWSMHNGIMVAPDTWAAGTIAIKDNPDGSTFTVYDVRAQFPRFWDDGRGADNGRTFGSAQGSQNLSHAHGSATGNAGAHNHTAWTDMQGQHTHAVLTYKANDFNSGSYVTGSDDPWDAGAWVNGTSAAGAHAHNIGVGWAADHWHPIGAEGGPEARPNNTALLASIKY